MTDAAAVEAAVPAILEVEDLYTYIATGDGVVRAVDGVSFSLREREILGLVGESGSGKSVTCRTIAGLMPSPPARSIGEVRYAGYPGRNLLELRPSEQQRLRGAHISMIFQDPMSALNPVMRVGDQIEEAVGAHARLSRASGASGRSSCSIASASPRRRADCATTRTSSAAGCGSAC